MTNPRASQDAAQALGQMGSTAKDAIPDLIMLVGDSDPRVRSSSADALGRIGPGTKNAVPKLAELLNDPNEDVRKAAAEGVGKIGRGAENAISDLIKLLGDVSANVRTSGATALGQIGPGTKDAVPDLIKLLKDPDVHVRASAAWALGQIGRAAENAVPDLIRMLEDHSANVRASCADALGRIGWATKDTIDALIKSLRDDDFVVRRSVIEALGQLGPVAKSAIPELVTSLKNPRAELRVSVLEALANIAETMVDIGEQDVTARRNLEEAVRFSELYKSTIYDHGPGTRIGRAVNHLKALERASLIVRAGEWLRTISLKDSKTCAVILCASWLLFLFTVFLVKPVWILRWDEALQDTLFPKITFADIEWSLGVTLAYVLLIRFFATRRFVLNTMAAPPDKIMPESSSVDGIDALIHAGGNYPDVSSEGSGMPDSLIVASPSVTGSMNPIPFYSCFISYSTKNQDFAERLHADLEANGVRTWFDQKHLKIGDKIRLDVNEAIGVHDKLLLILTKHSIASDWVEGEVEAALERERKEKLIVLFPIRLDDSVMETPIGWASPIRQTRHIGDFRGCKNHSAYQSAFARLLNDLRAEEPTGERAT